MRLAVRRQALDREHLAAVGLRCEDKAGAHERPVEHDGAGAALALLARVLRAGQAEPLAQRVEQALAGPDIGLLEIAVDRDGNPHVPGRLPLTAGGAGLRLRPPPPAALTDGERSSRERCSPGPCSFALFPPASHRQWRPRNVSELTPDTFRASAARARAGRAA